MQMLMGKNNPVYINKNVVHRRDKKWMDKNTSKEFKTSLTQNQQNYINCEKYKYFFLI